MKILALGDSYTIGEGVEYTNNYPSQLAKRFEKEGIEISNLSIIAKTGWTTGELLEAIKNQNLKGKFDYVLLLIGVNNQYRGYSIEDYKLEFQKLLAIAIDYSINGRSNVIVLSIPDWGNTPFADGKDKNKISREIDLYNEANLAISHQNNVHYITITDFTRMSPLKPSFLISDKLHPSGEMYSLWMERVWTHLKK